MYSNASLYPAIVTAASADHFREVMKLFENLNATWRLAFPDTAIYLYDIGLTEAQRLKVAFFEHYKIIFIMPIQIKWSTIELLKNNIHNIN